jgi:16S rRNA (cytosine1402-N4)-methyltransferase
MTYDDTRPPVKEILEEIDVKKLAKVISDYGGERFAMRIASAIKNREAVRKIETTRELREIILSAVPKNYERGRRRGGASRIDPATRTFQALRIYANDELENLKSVLENLKSILKPGGRAVVISFHSLEDGIVKRQFRLADKSGELKILTKKPIVPSASEVINNPASRSAKLRAAQIMPINANI